MLYRVAGTIALLGIIQAAHAQTTYQELPAKYYSLTQKAPAYKKADTLAVSQHVPASDEVMVVGKQSDALAVIKRAGFIYYMPSRYIKGLNAVRVPMQTDPTKGTYFYSEVVSVEGATKAELYRRAKKWVAVVYRSAQDVIQLDDPEGGELLIKGSINVGINNSYIQHILTISVKDGKYRYDIRDFVAVNTGNLFNNPLETPNFGYRKKFLERNDESINETISDLKKAMNPPAGQKNEDW